MFNILKKFELKIVQNLRTMFKMQLWSYRCFVDILCRLRLIDVVVCFSWLLTMLACGWLSESVWQHAVIIRLMLTLITVAMSCCSLCLHCSGGPSSKPCLLQCVQSCFISTGSFSRFDGSREPANVMCLLLHLDVGNSLHFSDTTLSYNQCQ